VNESAPPFSDFRFGSDQCLWLSQQAAPFLQQAPPEPQQSPPLVVTHEVRVNMAVSDRVAKMRFFRVFISLFGLVYLSCFSGQIRGLSAEFGEKACGIFFEFGDAWFAAEFHLLVAIVFGDGCAHRTEFVAGD
jgi:hypothetical protein